ncbi:MAG: hypothetical protein WCT50_03535 [Patescibacteria group bacterium]
MLNKKKLFVLVGILVVIIAAGLILFFSRSNKSTGPFDESIKLSEPVNLSPPEFMSAAEKAKLNLPEDSKIQVLKKNETGETEVYRIIRQDADIVLDPSRIGDPTMVQPKKTAN